MVCRRPGARFHTPASSTRAASNVFAFDANRSIRSNDFHTSVTSHNATSAGSSASTTDASNRSVNRTFGTATGVAAWSSVTTMHAS
jgi:hypothetical protein